MEGLLILVAIYVLDIVIKKVAENKKKQQLQRPSVPQDDKEQDAAPSPRKSLEELIRQFEESQRRDAQGTYTPPTPPIEDLDDEEGVELPTVEFNDPSRITFKEIAESVIQWEEVCIEYLMDAFGFSENTAKQVLAELQAHHIVGRDMGEGYCDLLVHDKTELENLFKREQREAEEREAAKAQESALQARREAELKHQKELAELEERARQLREQAQQVDSLPDAADGDSPIDAPCLSAADHRAHKRAFNRAEIRRGFVWAKVLDEPRFKKRWSSRVR